MKTLKDLGLSLLNATLMLVIIFVVLSLILVSRVSTLAESAGDAARASMAAPSARLEQIETTLAEISSNPTLSQADGARIDALAIELQKLNAQVSGLKENISDLPVQQIVGQIRAELGRVLIGRAPSEISQ